MILRNTTIKNNYRSLKKEQDKYSEELTYNEAKKQ